MQIAIDVAGFTAAEADQLRQAMGAKRSRQRMELLRGRFYDGMAERGITGEVADRSGTSWPPSPTSASPRATRCRSPTSSTPVVVDQVPLPGGLLRRPANAQPMGFYSPHSLVQDARRHGVEVRTPDVNASARPRPGGTAP